MKCTPIHWFSIIVSSLHLPALTRSATVYVTQAGQAPQYVVTSASPNNAYSTGAYVVQPPQLTMQSGYNNPAYSTQDNPYAYPKY